MKLIIFCTTLLLSVFTPAVFACIDRCSTTIKVVDCDDQPVPGATVTVECKSGGQAVSVTNAQGEVVARVCTYDIDQIGITANVEEEASGACASSPCTIKMCYSPIEETITITSEPPSDLGGYLIPGWLANTCEAQQAGSRH